LSQFCIAFDFPLLVDFLRNDFKMSGVHAHREAACMIAVMPFWAGAVARENFRREAVGANRSPPEAE